ncbi:MAG: beta-hydroxyacyl-ACP dehydratase [Planctomycetales bacterium]|nr:beta-hydroxyacyl-ACP dehydratase [Planctomycetales bacterium]
MRWFWIDRFIEFKSGSHAKSIKNVTFAEDHLHDHQPGFPVMPASLILEGLAQTGGILLGEQRQFSLLVVLAKVPRMTFHSWACPGDTLTYAAKLTDSRDEGGMVDVTAHIGDRLVAEGEIVFAHLSKEDAGAERAEQMSCVFTLLRGILDVGKAENR